MFEILHGLTAFGLAMLLVVVTIEPNDALDERKGTWIGLFSVLVGISRLLLALFVGFFVADFPESLSALSLWFIVVPLLIALVTTVSAHVWFYWALDSPWNQFTPCDHCGRHVRLWVQRQRQTGADYVHYPPDPNCAECRGSGAVVFSWEYGDVRSCSCVRYVWSCGECDRDGFRRALASRTT